MRLDKYYRALKLNPGDSLAIVNETFKYATELHRDSFANSKDEDHEDHKEYAKVQQAHAILIHHLGGSVSGSALEGREKMSLPDRVIRALKYPIYFFMLLLFSRLVYICLESNYHQHILDIVSAAGVGKSDIEGLNDYGHTLASVGITLALAPFWFWLAGRWENIWERRLLYFVVFSVLSFSTIRVILGFVVDEIVAVNEDKAYEAYYVQQFKYGILNNIFGYEDYMPRRHIETGGLTLDDKIVAANSFLVTLADDRLLDRLAKKGRQRIPDIYAAMNPAEYDALKYEFETLFRRMEHGWNEFQSKRKDLNEELMEGYAKAVASESKQFDSMNIRINEAYADYMTSVKAADAKVSEIVTVKNINQFYRELSRFFRWRKYSSAISTYTKNMSDSFGHYIEPERWCSGGKCPHKGQIKKVITEEIFAKRDKKLKGIPARLSFRKFRQHDQVKKTLARELGFGTRLYNFNYTKQSFNRLYWDHAKRKKSNFIDSFVREANKKLKTKGLTIGATWADFVNSSAVDTRVSKAFPGVRDEVRRDIKRMMLNADMSRFKELVYMPLVKNKVDGAGYSRIDFERDPEAISVGKDAIKLLYVPPFALSLSMLSLLMNIISVVLMLVSVICLGYRPIMIITCSAFLLLILALPFSQAVGPVKNPIMEKIKTKPLIGEYVDFLHWLKFYQQYNGFALSIADRR
ncbi:MAG: hypothetical protein RPS47_04225 [Colwellia sp.]|jgi:hypothetical protein